MKARQLIDGASFGPEALKAISHAFDEAWREIAGNFGDDSGDIERARHKLAKALPSVASEDSPDVEVLKQAAMPVAFPTARASERVTASAAAFAR